MDRQTVCQRQHRFDREIHVEQCLERHCDVLVDQGLSMLRCSQLISLFESFDGTIRVSHGEIAADGRSMIELLQLKATRGTTLTFTLIGADPGRIMDKVEVLLTLGNDKRAGAKAR